MVRRIAIMMVVVAQYAIVFSQSAVPTLSTPSGARSLGMGEVGTALADDEDAPYYNPAGLGIQNTRWRAGAATYFYEPMYAAWNIPDYWYSRFAGVYQPDLSKWGGFAAYYNTTNFGVNVLTNELGSEIYQARSYENVYGLSWGFNFADIGILNHYFGFSVKYVYSALFPGMGSGSDGVGQTFAVDAGYIWNFIPSMKLGLCLQNMGPSIFYISPLERDPIPFTFNAALAYSKDFMWSPEIVFGQVRAEIRTDREIVKNYVNQPPDPFWRAITNDLFNDTSRTFKQQLNEFGLHLGVEYTLLNTLSLRYGFLLFDPNRWYENHWGFGIKMLNHFQIDNYWIYSPKGYLGWLFNSEGSYGVRHGQWGINLTFFNMFNWTENDRTWWKIHDR